MVAIDKLKEETVIVFVSGLNLIDSPDIVQEAMSSEEAWGPTPIVAVFDAKLESQLGIVPYLDMKDVKGFDDVKSALADMRGVAVEESKMVNLKPEAWKDTRGRTIQATYVTSSESDVTLRLSNGKLATIELSRLNEASQDRVKELAGE